jgi:hypothetical protein
MAAFSVTSNQPSFGQIIRFAQISDAHMYEYKNKDTDSKPENERGVRWAIDEINRRNESGPKYDFVVFTGDLNLEVILKSVPTLNRLSEKHGKRYDRLYSELEEAFRPDQSAQLNKAIDECLQEPVRHRRDFLRNSNVKLWILLPGNNDLMDEMPVTTGCFHRFVQRLQSELGSSKNILDFAQNKGVPARLVLGNCHFFGFDNAAFKNNNTTIYLDKIESLEKCSLNSLKGEIQRCVDMSQSGNRGPNCYSYVFCHIPDVSDPYLHSLSLEELRKKLDTPGNRKIDGPYCRSAWTRNGPDAQALG